MSDPSSEPGNDQGKEPDSQTRFEPMQWHAPIREVVDAINDTAQKHERDPVFLAATALVIAIVNQPGRFVTAWQVFN